MGHEKVTSACRFFFSTGIRPFCTFAVKRSSSLASKINLAAIIDDSSCNEDQESSWTQRFQDFVQVNMTISIFMKFLKINFLKPKRTRKLMYVKISVNKKFIYLNYKQLKFYLNETREKKEDKIKKIKLKIINYIVYNFHIFFISIFVFLSRI